MGEGGDAETGAGMDSAGGLDPHRRRLGVAAGRAGADAVVDQGGGSTECRMSVSVGWNATPSSSLGLTARAVSSGAARRDCGHGRGGGSVLCDGLDPTYRAHSASTSVHPYVAFDLSDDLTV